MEKTGHRGQGAGGRTTGTGDRGPGTGKTGRAPIPENQAGATRRAPVTVPEIVASKGKRRLVMVTAVDEPSARWVDRAGVDLVLVGDSLAMAALGRPNTLSVTIGEMIHHTRAAAAGVRHALLVADMPFGSFQVSVEDAVRNACRLVAEGGAQAVKLEGARTAEAAAIVAAGVPVVGHLGLTPQSLNALGGYHVQGRHVEAARHLLENARALEGAGIFLLILEAIPPAVGELITRAVAVPTVGIGAGAGCDGQVLVFADLLGLSDEPLPRFVRRYASLGETIQDAVATYAADVREGRYPAPNECYPSAPGLAEALADELGGT
jgi:3-methyl-2-oxobutanoate hydroxymethyltransferase